MEAVWIKSLSAAPRRFSASATLVSVFPEEMEFKGEEEAQAQAAPTPRSKGAPRERHAGAARAQGAQRGTAGPETRGATCGSVNQRLTNRGTSQTWNTTPRSEVGGGGGTSRTTQKAPQQILLPKSNSKSGYHCQKQTFLDSGNGPKANKLRIFTQERLDLGKNSGSLWLSSRGGNGGAPISPAPRWCSSTRVGPVLRWAASLLGGPGLGRAGGWAAGEGSATGADLVQAGAQKNPGAPVRTNSELDGK